MRALPLVLLLAGLAPKAPAPGPFALEPVAKITLRGELARLADVRFDGDDKLLLSAYGYGVAQATYDRKSARAPQLLLPEDRSTGIVIPQYLASSSDYLAIASPMSQMIWWQRGRTDRYAVLGTWGPTGEAPISFFEDLDIRGDRLAVLGLMRGERSMSPDGAIAWTARLSDPRPRLEPLAFSTTGVGAQPYDRCAVFSIGKLRFLVDGSLLLVRGAEPGIHLYSPDGKLLKTWDSRGLGLDLRCDFDEQTGARYGSVVESRIAYVNRFVTVDEVLPTHPHPSLVMRWVVGKETRWKLVVLREDGTTAEVPLPVVYPSDRMHLRGDVRGDRLVLITQEDLPDGRDDHSDLWEFRIVPPAGTTRARLGGAK